MSDVYVLEEDGKTASLKRIDCASEDRELQMILERNLNLLPKAQLGIENSRGWLQIKREMPVPSPETGENTWSLDFLLADDEAVATLVECKRFQNTQSRREIVGQLLEYAANGKSYWTKEELISHAQRTAKGEEALRLRVEQLSNLSVDAYFEKLISNLKLGNMRLVFFLENTSRELRSVVEFLSEQLTGVEIFLVEARHYQRGDLRVVVPWVFGYTEATRMESQKVRAAAKSASDAGVGEQAFWTALDASALTSEQKGSMRQIVAFAQDTSGCDVLWGRGPRFIFPGLGSESYLFAMRRGGAIEWNLSTIAHLGAETEPQRENISVLSEINATLGTSFSADAAAKYPQTPLAFWLPKLDRMQALISRWSSI